MFWQKIWVIGCARDCSISLPAVTKNLTRFTSLFYDSEIIILENDSADHTRALLKKYQDNSLLRFYSLNNIDRRFPTKTERLAFLRNACISYLKTVTSPSSDDLVMILDLDEVNSHPWNLPSFISALNWFSQKESVASISANQIGIYYDLWAFRHSVLCPSDIWRLQYLLHLRNPHLSDNELMAAALNSPCISFDPSAPPIPVDSAFGGLAFYKLSWLYRLNDSPYIGTCPFWSNQNGKSSLRSIQVSEHVSFHKQLRMLGAELYIHPGLINWDTRFFGNALPFRPGYWRELLC